MEAVAPTSLSLCLCLLGPAVAVPSYVSLSLSFILTAAHDLQFPLHPIGRVNPWKSSAVQLAVSKATMETLITALAITAHHQL